MVLPVVYRQAARRELQALHESTEEQRRELGSLFLDEIARIETHISDAPSPVPTENYIRQY